MSVFHVKHRPPGTALALAVQSGLAGASRGELSLGCVISAAIGREAVCRRVIDRAEMSA